MNNAIFSVSDLTRKIKYQLESNFQDIWLEGEISNIKFHSSGHLYFSLKDDSAQISAVMWKNRVSNLHFRPHDGLKVVVHGRISLYEPRGTYQIDCVSLQPSGIGELQKAFEELKQKLLAEGLFAEERKRPIPIYPKKIGVITSSTGAALRDMMQILARRQPSIELLLFPVKVQGIGAAEEIVEAIDYFSKHRNVDIIIVGRGGGSLEDLWAFNEEIVARAIFRSAVPIISAVGHEIDFTISDFVADLRAPTPSAAAELAVRDRRELIENLLNYCYTIENTLLTRIDFLRNTVQRQIQSYSFNKPLDIVQRHSQYLDDLRHRLGVVITSNVKEHSMLTQSLSKRLQSLNPTSILKRGFAIVRKGGKIVAFSTELRNGDRASIEFIDGTKNINVSD